jgi:hypothetical protein
MMYQVLMYTYSKTLRYLNTAGYCINNVSLLKIIDGVQTFDFFQPNHF